MISGREPNILRCLSPEIQAQELAKQRQAEAAFTAKVEKTEQKVFLKWLKDERAAGRLYFINPRSDKASTIEPGHPDFTIWVKGYCFLIEMKAEGGNLSAQQHDVIGELEHLEHHVYIAWNHIQAENIVQFYLSNSVIKKGINDNRISKAVQART